MCFFLLSLCVLVGSRSDKMGLEIRDLGWDQDGMSHPLPWPKLLNRGKPRQTWENSKENKLPNNAVFVKLACFLSPISFPDTKKIKQLPTYQSEQFLKLHSLFILLAFCQIQWKINCSQEKMNESEQGLISLQWKWMRPD